MGMAEWVGVDIWVDVAEMGMADWVASSTSLTSEATVGLLAWLGGFRGLPKRGA